MAVPVANPLRSRLRTCGFITLGPNDWPAKFSSQDINAHPTCSQISIERMRTQTWSDFYAYQIIPV